MFRLPVVSSAMDARIETTLDDFHVESTEDRDALKDSLLKLKEVIRRNPKRKYIPKDNQSMALFGMYAHLEALKG
jgi:hypothetical protein